GARVIALPPGKAHELMVDPACLLLEVCLNGAFADQLELAPAVVIALQKPSDSHRGLQPVLELLIIHRSRELESAGRPLEYRVDILCVDGEVRYRGVGVG